MTFVIYVMIMFGGFVEMWGVDHSFTLKHYIEAFSIDFVEERGLLWTGTAWNSFNVTFIVAIVSCVTNCCNWNFNSLFINKTKI